MLDFFFVGIILHFALLFDNSNAAIQDCNGPESNDSVQELYDKENKKEEPCAQSKGRLLQLQIQALQVIECGHENTSSKFIMAKPLRWSISQYGHSQSE